MYIKFLLNLNIVIEKENEKEESLEQKVKKVGRNEKCPMWFR